MLRASCCWTCPTCTNSKKKPTSRRRPAGSCCRKRLWWPARPARTGRVPTAQGARHNSWLKVSKVVVTLRITRKVEQNVLRITRFFRVSVCSHMTIWYMTAISAHKSGGLGQSLTNLHVLCPGQMVHHINGVTGLYYILTKC